MQEAILTKWNHIPVLAFMFEQANKRTKTLQANSHIKGKRGPGTHEIYGPVDGPTDQRIQINRVKWQKHAVPW